MSSTVAVDRSEITHRAYARWQQRGCPVGSPEHDWYEAEQELVQASAALEVKTAPKAPPVAVAMPTAEAPVATPAVKKAGPPRPRARRGTISSTLAASAAVDASASESKAEAVAGGNRKSRRAARSA